MLREKLREAPLNGGVSILRQECTKAGAHIAQQRGRQYIDVSSKAIDTYEAQLCEDGGDGGTARVVVIEIEVERLLFCRKRYDPKNLVVEFFDHKDRSREVL